MNFYQDEYYLNAAVGKHIFITKCLSYHLYNNNRFIDI